ncbi:ATP-binding protein [Gallaecimonas kandeliae]|uniref:ATP-binding protein n=1 Tax=Gallaecimonas kandeliae TaxID=3029055 RepID=UPI0026488DF6|nr:ATP-binding protein [Gallaecimonas kandeliae]WKE64567.1 ATP-binding protein [Gallaecimonas kandeliae]
MVFCAAGQAEEQFDESLFAPTLFTADTADTALASQELLKLAQDDRGFIWVGTQRGLYRFDGYENRKMTSEGMPFDVSNIYVRSLLADGDFLWIGTMASGLFRLDLRSYRFEQFKPNKQNPDGIGASQINAIKKDKEGNLWLAHSFGLDKLDLSRRHFGHFVSADNPKDKYFNYLLDLAFDGQGRLWLSSAKGLARFNPAEGHFALAKGGDFEALKGVVVRRIHRAKDGRLWLATQKQGTYLVAPGPGTVTRLETPASRQDAANTDIVETGKEVWLSGALGVEIRDAGTGRLKKVLRGNLLDKHGLRGDIVLPMLKSRSGLVWLGVSNVGLQFYNPQTRRFRYFDRYAPQLESAFSAYLAGVLKIDDSQLIVINQNQTSRLDLGSGKSEPLLTSPAFKNTPFFCGIKAPDGHYWFGGGNGDIFRVDLASQDVKAFTLPLAKTAGVFIRHFALGKKGELWIGSDRGLVKLDLNTLSFSLPKNQDGSPFITYARRLTVDKQNRLWIGTTSGLGVIDSGQDRVRFYSQAEGTQGTLRSNLIVQVLQNRKGEILVYHRAGIDRLVSEDKGQLRFVPFAEQATAQADSEDGLLQLDNGHYWLGTRYLLGEDGQLLQALSEADGALGQGLDRDFFALNDSLLLHASMDGLALMDKAAGPAWGYLAPLAVTDLEVGNRRLTYDYSHPEIRVPSDAGQFSLRFASLDYSDPKANRYRYQLVGYDPDWVSTPTDVRQAKYTALPPGDYQLRIEGSNRKGQWSGSPLTLKVVIEPKFFETLWFRLLMLLLGTLMLAWLFRWRLAVAKAKQQDAFEKREAIRKAEMMTELMEQKNQMLAEVTHDLRTPLAMVKVQLEAMQDGVLQPDERSYEALQARLAGLNHLVGDIYQLSLMDSGALVLHKAPVELGKLVASVVDAFQAMMQQKQLRLALVDSSSPGLEVMADEGRLVQVLNNLLKNSYRYTDNQGLVQVSLGEEGAWAVLRVEDSNPGPSSEERERIFERLYRAESTRAQSQSGSGLGLWICKSIVEAHGGEISADASALGGLAITIKLPL